MVMIDVQLRPKVDEPLTARDFELLKQVGDCFATGTCFPEFAPWVANVKPGCMTLRFDPSRWSNESLLAIHMFISQIDDFGIMSEHLGTFFDTLRRRLDTMLWTRLAAAPEPVRPPAPGAN